MVDRVTVSIVTVPECAPLAKSVHRILSNTKPLDINTREGIIRVETKLFADGSSRPQIMSSVRRTEVYFFYAMPLREPERGLARLEFLLNALHLASPISIKVIMPYFEGRQDRKDAPRTAITAKVWARAIERERSVNGVMTFDLHAEQLMLAFDTPVDNLWGQRLLANHAKKMSNGDTEFGVVAPDVGSTKRAKKFAVKAGLPLLGVIDKERSGANEIMGMRYIGSDLTGYHVIFPDDLIDTGGTMVLAHQLARRLGAINCTAYATHWLASPKGNLGSATYTAENKFRDAGLRVVALNTIPRSGSYIIKHSDFLTFVPCDDMLASAIAESLTPAGSVSMLSE